jgi:predicted amidophosphoribosyltransferase
MVCLVCHGAALSTVCPKCHAGLRPAAEHVLPGGLPLVAAFEHSGPAPSLVHLLKYRGVVFFADYVAEALATRVPRLPLVPVPRAMSRRLRYGVDPALEIARRLAIRLEVPVWQILRPPIHARRRAGGDHSVPGSGFGVRRRPSSRVVLVDDVVTTGATIMSACDALGPDRVALAASANVVPAVSSLLAPDTEMRRPAPTWPRS